MCCPDFYIGGTEHAALHLLHARFWHQFLYDIGAVHSSTEPFPRLYHQGIVFGSDGVKMSKRRGNVVNPDDIVHHGADSLRLYEMLLGPLNATKPWNERDIAGLLHRCGWDVKVLCDFGSGSRTKPQRDDRKGHA